MTNNEAKEFLMSFKNDDNWGDGIKEALDMAIKELEKQIPKKPVYEGDGYDLEGNIIFDEWLCPCCGTRYEVDYDEYDFCPNCGQAIDWSEKE